MLHEVTGDILLTKAQAIAHGIAPNEHFDSGLALSLRENWPAMAKDYRHYAHMQSPESGDIWVWRGAGSKHIINLLTQTGEHTHGARHGPATLANVNHCLRKLRLEIEKSGIKSIALPRLATGVGTLDWKDVQPLIAQHLATLNIPVYLYVTYHQGMQANEPGI